MVRLWHRLLIMDDNRITTKIFLWSLRNEHMWAKKIKHVFDMLDFGYLLWINVDVWFELC